MPKFLDRNNEAQVQVALHAMAMIPDDAECRAHLLEQHGFTITDNYLKWLRRQHPERFQEARDAVAQSKERALSSDLMDNAEAAARVVSLAIKSTEELIREGRCQDPSKVARDIADVQAKAIDKSRLLADKPTQIVAKRNIDDDIRFLEQKGIIPKQIEVETIDVDSEDHPEDARTPAP